VTPRGGGGGSRLLVDSDRFSLLAACCAELPQRSLFQLPHPSRSESSLGTTKDVCTAACVKTRAANILLCIYVSYYTSIVAHVCVMILK
jgi:hypothetical protein